MSECFLNYLISLQLNGRHLGLSQLITAVKAHTSSPLTSSHLKWRQNRTTVWYLWHRTDHSAKQGNINTLKGREKNQQQKANLPGGKSSQHSASGSTSLWRENQTQRSHSQQISHHQREWGWEWSIRCELKSHYWALILPDKEEWSWVSQGLLKSVKC